MRRSQFALFTLFGGIAIMLVIGIFFSVRKITSPPLPSQSAGQVTQQDDNTFLKGGILQRGIAQSPPEEFIQIDTGTGVPNYTKHEFTVHSDKIVSITLHNRSKLNQQHDWVLVRPGTQQKVEDEAENAGPIWEWIPQTSNILAFVPMTQPGQSRTALFRAPKDPGDYPFFCTFPGHGNTMNGTLHVIK